MRVRQGLLLLPLCLRSALGQPAEPPARFTALTIKPATSEESAFAQSFFGRASWWTGRCGDFGPKKGLSLPDSFASKCIVTFANVLGHAYHLNAAQFPADRRKESAWMESTWFRIQAKAPPGATEDQFRIMEQNLLADRFKLSAHLEKRELVNYEMTVTAGGPKFHPGAKQPGASGHTIGVWQNGVPLIMGDGVSMDQLTSFLSYNLDWPVADATGLSGFYKLNLNFEPTIMGLNQDPPKIQAVRDQLGLILERTKTVMDVLVIDHVEQRPTPQ
jgi:uncharacterized protein (TIGR03435 family)